MKIAVYAISKNEEKFVETFCESAKDADLILIADTGSTDNTVKEALRCGATPFNITVTPWRFDKARDIALGLIPSDFDVCISLDLDEKLEPGWREEIERLWKDGTTRLRYKFDWGSGIVFYSEKIHARKGYFWHHPCHEYIKPDPRTEEVWANTDFLMITHHPDPTKSRGQYMDLLEMSVKEDPHCPRNAFYYARELTFYSRFEEAIVALKRYLDMPEAVWANERSYAMRLLGRCHEALYGGGMAWYRRACAEDPTVRETWVDLAGAAYRKQLWEECYGAAKSALKIQNRVLVYTTDPEAWGSMPHDFAAIAAHHLGLKDEAIKQGEIAVSLDPNNERLIKNLEFYKA